MYTGLLGIVASRFQHQEKIGSMIFDESIMRMLFAKALGVDLDTDWEDLVHITETLRTDVTRLTVSLKKSTDTTAGFDSALKYRSDTIAKQAETIASLERALLDTACAYSIVVAGLTAEMDARPAITREDAAYYANAYGEDTHGWRGARLRVDAALRTHAKGTP